MTPDADPRDAGSGDPAPGIHRHEHEHAVLREQAADVRQEMVDARLRARMWTRDNGEDAPDVTGWRWNA